MALFQLRNNLLSRQYSVSGTSLWVYDYSRRRSLTTIRLQLELFYVQYASHHIPSRSYTI